MKAWHHLWHSLGATESQIQCLILLNAEICMREEAEAIEVWSPSFPRSLKTVWQGQNEQSIGQVRLRYPKPIAEILSNTHRKPWTRALLESALPTQVNFMQKEWAAFGIANLHCNDYIMSKINNVVHYFQPAANKFDQWAYKSEASEEYKQMTLRTFQTVPQ